MYPTSKELLADHYKRRAKFSKEGGETPASASASTSASASASAPAPTSSGTAQSAQQPSHWFEEYQYTWNPSASNTATSSRYNLRSRKTAEQVPACTAGTSTAGTSTVSKGKSKAKGIQKFSINPSQFYSQNITARAPVIPAPPPPPVRSKHNLFTRPKKLLPRRSTATGQHILHVRRGKVTAPAPDPDPDSDSDTDISDNPVSEGLEINTPSPHPSETDTASSGEETDTASSREQSPEPLEHIQLIAEEYFDPDPPAMATTDEIRLIIQQTLGPLGPELTNQGALVNNGEVRPTLSDRLTSIKKKTDNPKPPGPSIYSGSTEENPSEWKSKMKDYIDHGGYITDVDQMRVTKMHLKGRALIWFKNLEGAKKDTWDHFVVEFDNKFIKGESKYIAQQALYDRKQLATETPENYVEDVLVKADMLNWTKDQTRQHLVAGLQESLKPYVIMANPQTLEATCDVILRAHNAQGQHGEPGNTRNTEPTGRNTQSNQDGEESHLCSYTTTTAAPASASSTE